MASSDLSSLTPAGVSIGARRSSAVVRARQRFPWRLAWIVFGVWTALDAFAIAQTAVMFGQRGVPFQWTWLAANRSIDWYTCALFTPVFFWLVRRYPLDSVRPRITVPMYVAVTSACVVLKYAIMLPLERLVGGPGGVTLGGLLAQEFLLEFLIFCGLIAIIHALQLQRRLSQREQLALELRAQLSEAELEVLKGQLQPHFLFNTLNGVASLIHTAPDAADFVVVQLADLLRSSLEHKGARLIPLTDELTLLDKYLGIMEARFHGRLSIHREIDPSALVALVPQFLLQPLVENAFEHGIARRAGAGRITIRASAETGRLRLEVSDDGAGLSREADPGEGVGLGNTRQRLERLYGEEQSLRLRRSPGAGRWWWSRFRFVPHERTRSDRRR